MHQYASTTSSELPLQGAILCCTSIAPEQRTRLAEYATEMGAAHRLDLTSDVTHLLVGDTNTPKYQYVAREREDVKVLKPDWVEAIRELWMQDQPLDLDTLEIKYRLPALYGLKICITGFDDLSFRAQLQRNIVEHGGEYTGDLTRDVTHLIASAPTGKKYEYATTWQLKVVTLKWYKDTLARGMQLEELKYHPTKPVEEQGIGAWNREQRPPSNLGKRTRDVPQGQEPIRKLRRTASAKLGSQNDHIWNSIGGAPQVEESFGQQGPSRPIKSMSDIGISRQNTVTSVKSDNEQGTVRDHAQSKSHPPALENVGFLHHLHLAMVGFNQQQTDHLRNTLRGCGATVYEDVQEIACRSEPSREYCCVVVPHQIQEHALTRLREAEKKVTWVNELWLEWCMTKRSYVSPRDYPLGGLVGIRALPDALPLKINVTGFDAMQTLHISKLVRLKGVTYNEMFTPTTTVLVCHQTNHNPQKFQLANQWKIPVVSEAWLVQLLQAKDVPSYKDYLLQMSSETDDDFMRPHRNNRPRQDSSRSGALRPVERPTPSASASASSQDMNAPSRSNNNPSAGPRDVNSPKHSDHYVFIEPEPRHSDEHNGSRRSVDIDLKPQPLQDLSTNAPTRKSPPAEEGKKRLFRTFEPRKEDASISKDVETQNDARSITPTNSAKAIDAVQEFLNLKAEAKAKAAAAASKQEGLPSGSGNGNRGLLGRALSNLSTGSNNANHRMSRASSVDTMNTDGLGTELSANNTNIDTYDQGGERQPPRKFSNDVSKFTGRAKPKSSSQAVGEDEDPPASPAAERRSEVPISYIDLNDPGLLRDELIEPALGTQATQLGYEDSAESIALREKLAERRRARGRLGQNEDDPKPAGVVTMTRKEREREKEKESERRTIKDDEAYISGAIVGGRRTRLRERKLAEIEGWE